MGNMEQIIKNIDELLEQLKKCAYGWTMPSGNETGCMPSHFASNTIKLFAEIDKINEVSYHEVYEEECYIRLPLNVVLACIKETDGIVIHYEDGNRGVMHSTYVFMEQYLDYLKEYCKGIKSYLNN